MRVGVSTLLVTLLTSACAAQSDAADATASKGTEASATASASAAPSDDEWKIEDSIPPECALQCNSYLELYHECYDTHPEDSCALWCDTKNYNAVVSCYNCGLALNPNVTNSANVDLLVKRFASDCETLVGSVPTGTIQVLYPGRTQAPGSAEGGPIDFLNQTTTGNPLPSSTSGNPLTPVLNAPSAAVAPSATPASGAQLVTPGVAVLAVIAAVAMAL